MIQKHEKAANEPERRRDRDDPVGDFRGLIEYLWRIEQVNHAVANGYVVGTINRVGIEKDNGDDDCYGQSYFCDPRGQFIGVSVLPTTRS